ncbi:MAG: ImmA/IrrE family metallo-endopeptidase [Ruminococcus sp.]|nr:ImmA/IrrE family metallo-endopeptidase [Ruminococcus sp.]
MTISELYDFAVAHDIEIVSQELPTVESYSVMFPTTGNCYIGMDYSKIESAADEKTKLAHEIGHCEKGAFYNRYAKYDLISRQEYRADKWAVLHTMPKKEVIAAMKCGCTEVWQLAEWFGVSERLVRRAMWIYFDKEAV